MVTLIKSVLYFVLYSNIAFSKFYRGKYEAKVGRMIDFCNIIPSIISRVLCTAQLQVMFTIFEGSMHTHCS